MKFKLVSKIIFACLLIGGGCYFAESTLQSVCAAEKTYSLDEAQKRAKFIVDTLYAPFKPLEISTSLNMIIGGCSIKDPDASSKIITINYDLMKNPNGGGKLSVGESVFSFHYLSSREMEMKKLGEYFSGITPLYDIDYEMHMKNFDLYDDKKLSNEQKSLIDDFKGMGWFVKDIKKTKKNTQEEGPWCNDSDGDQTPSDHSSSDDDLSWKMNLSLDKNLLDFYIKNKCMIPENTLAFVQKEQKPTMGEIKISEVFIKDIAQGLQEGESIWNISLDQEIHFMKEIVDGILQNEDKMKTVLARLESECLVLENANAILLHQIYDMKRICLQKDQNENKNDPILVIPPLDHTNSEEVSKEHQQNLKSVLLPHDMTSKVRLIKGYAQFLMNESRKIGNLIEQKKSQNIELKEKNHSLKSKIDAIEDILKTVD